MLPASFPIRIGIIGCQGRVGHLLTQELLSGDWKEQAELSGGIIRAEEQSRETFFVTTDPMALFARSDVLIDFTRPEVTVHMAEMAADHKLPYVSGTTGLDDAQEHRLEAAARHSPIVYAANMSVGVTLLATLVEQAAARLGPEWDLEILESHHRNKVDAPSGTAVMLGKAAAKGRGGADFAIDRTGKREAGTIGYAVRRGGDVVGEHAVTFYGMGERLELSHMATDRRLFARGAIRAALWAVDKAPGLYTMRDVLGLS